MYNGPMSDTWFGKTAEDLGRFSHILDMNSWFLDQICDTAFNLADRIRKIGSNLSWLPTAVRPLTRRARNLLALENIVDDTTETQKNALEPYQIQVDHGFVKVWICA